jgi:hypothetical protein
MLKSRMREIRTSGSEGALGAIPQGDPTPLDRVVHDAHSKAQLDGAERIFDGAPAAEAAQKADSGSQAHRDVNRMPGCELRPAHVGHAGLQSILRLPASAPALATPGRKLHRELLHEID